MSAPVSVFILIWINTFSLKPYFNLIWAIFLNCVYKKFPEVCSIRASQVVLAVKNWPASAGDIRDVGSISGQGRLSGEGDG